MPDITLHMQHTSLQFSDSPSHQRQDIKRVFALGRGFPIKTGTEAGPESGNDNRAHLLDMARDFNHHITFAAGNWIAVDRSIIKPKSVRTGSVFVVDRRRLTRGHDRIMATMSFTPLDPLLAPRVAVGAVHYPIRRDGEWNKLYAQNIAKWMRHAGRGERLSFVNGDFNMDDRKTDWSFGQPFTSMADELKAWKNTGHGPIDGFASYDPDGRVKAHKFRVLNDKRQFMHFDHFVCQGTWKVRPLSRPTSKG